MTSILGKGFTYECEIIRPDGTVQERDQAFNLLPQVSVDHMAGMMRGSGGFTPISTWFMFLFEGNYVPTSGVTAADLPGVVAECTSYAATTRPAWTNTYDGINIISNLANKAVFTMNAAKRVYGAGIVSTSVKGGNTGLLLSIARFATAKDLDAGTQFSLAAGITLIPSS